MIEMSLSFSDVKDVAIFIFEILKFFMKKGDISVEQRGNFVQILFLFACWKLSDFWFSDAWGDFLAGVLKFRSSERQGLGVLGGGVLLQY